MAKRKTKAVVEKIGTITVIQQLKNGARVAR